jgi:tetratricopeptide (TPR) repeat protein
MKNTVTRRLAPLLTGLALGLIAAPAYAGNDKEALKLAEQALYEDYLNLEFASAEKKLKKALALCESDCNPTNQARVFRDMGVLNVAGLQKREEGIEMFKKALATDPTITLDDDLSTPDIESAFQEAQAASGGGDSALSAAMRSSVVPTDDEPPPEETDPLLAAAEAENAKMEELEAAKEPTPKLSTSGSGEIEPEPEPVEAAAAVEMDDEDCPPDFPGCGGDDDEEDDLSEFARHWVSVAFQQDFLLMDATSQACTAGKYQCFYGQGVYRDSTVYPTGVPGADGMIIGGQGEIATGFARATQRILVGYDYALLNTVLLGGRVGFALGGGPQKNPQPPSTSPPGKQFLPIHIELRAAYWPFGVDEGSVRPFLQLSGGMAQVDAKVSTPIVDGARQAYCSSPLVNAATDPDCYSVSVDAWKKAGTVFLSAGFGMMFAFGDSHGLVVDGRGMQLLGADGLAVAATGGYSVGF